MNVTPFHCGPFANESERTAFEHLKSRIESSLGANDDQWMLLTNLTWSVTHQFQADEIDMVAIGPPGVRVIEVKHWSRRWVDEHPDLVVQEADKVTNKARKVGTTSRKSVPDLGRVDGVILLTRESPDMKELAGRVVRGVRFCTLREWREAIDFDGTPALRRQQVALLGRRLEPKSAVALDGSLRRFAGYVNLERRTPPVERFHRVYRGVHATRQDKVVLHLYDLSASDAADAETRASRECEALRRLQLHTWAPRVLDSWQPAPGYAGEMHFFTVTDPLAPALEKRASDRFWDTPARLAFARAALNALIQLHGETVDDAPILHRNLTPETVLVRHDNTPIFTGFELSKIPSERSVASAGPPTGEWPPSTAPEVRVQGLHAADTRSDRYALCASLRVLFEGRKDDTSRQALDVLASGMTDDSSQRSDPSALDARLSELLGESPPAPPPPPARFWTEDQIVPFRGSRYRVVERLGAGGVGTAFKVVQIDRKGNEEGTYVAKVCHDEEAGRRAVNAYRLARSHLQHQAVSGIFEVASEWRENEFTALMTWVDGSPLRDFTGVLPLLVDDIDETSADALTLFWLRTMCKALDVLHRNGLVHGDVNPGNLIVSGRDLVLTDYDFVSRIDEPIVAPGALLYCSPSHLTGRAASPSDDMYALAASFFHVMFEHEPFRHDGTLAKERGLNWEAVDPERRAEYPSVAAFLDRATHPDPDQRFHSAAEAQTVLVAEPPPSAAAVAPPGPTTAPLATATERQTGSVSLPAPSAGSAAAPEAPDTRPGSPGEIPGVRPPSPGASPEPPDTLPVGLPSSSAAAIAPDPEPSAPPTSAAAPPEGRPSPRETPDPEAVRREQRVEWLRWLLQSYPGSRWGNRETRGLDSDFAEQTYVETPLEAALYEDVRARRTRLVVLCGNAGDGKTALLQHLAGRFGLERRASSERVLEGETDDGLRVRMNLDGSASWLGRSADDLLDEFLAPFREGPPSGDIAHLLAINDGRLLEWIERVERRDGETPLTEALYEALQRVQQDRWEETRVAERDEHEIRAVTTDTLQLAETETPVAGRDESEHEREAQRSNTDATATVEVAARDEHDEREDAVGTGDDPAADAAGDADARPRPAPAAHIRFVNLNQRSLVGGVTADGTNIETGFLESLVDRLYGASRAPEIWAPCATCSAQDRCEVFRANRLFGPAGLPGAAPAEARSRARDRLFEALQAVHLRGETHVTVRELRAALVYILFGVHFCDDYHAGAAPTGHRPAPGYWDPSFGPFPEPDAPAETAPASLPWWDRAFDPESPARQGAVLSDLARFDPALDAHPRIDRHLVRPTRAGVPGFPDLELASARRRAYFEWREHDIESITEDPHTLDLAHGRHLRRFRKLVVDAGARKAACRELCDGIARLATLPPQAYDRSGVVPLRITPRTPTETAFWIEKAADRFHLEVDLPPEAAGLDRLHRQASLIYRYRNGREERLRLGAELFHLLMELSEGYQLGDASTDDTFAHLSIFVQRLEREDDRRLLAWNPMRDDGVYEVVAESTSEDGPQRIFIRPLV